MKRILCAVHDAALDSYLSLFTAPTVGGARRSFGDEVGKSDSPLHAHPEHYALYSFGTFDDESGKFDVLPVPSMICHARDFVPPG